MILGRNPEEVVGTLVRLPDTLQRDVISSLAVLPQSETDSFGLDALLLALAAREAVATLGRSGNLPIMVNVRSDIFSTHATTERYLALCDQLDARVRSRLVLLLSGIPDGLPTTQLLEWTNRLRPYWRSVGFEAEDLENEKDNENRLGTLSQPHCRRSGNAFDRSISNKLRHQVSVLHIQHAQILVRGVVSDNVAAAYFALGADMISMAPQIYLDPRQVANTPLPGVSAQMLPAG